MYKRVVTSSGKRSLKKLPRRVREDILGATNYFAGTRENFYEKLSRLFC